MLCAFAHLTNAQVEVPSGTNGNRPDSIYIYSGKNRTLQSGAAISYDEAGRKILEDGFVNKNGDDLLDENDQAHKTEYTYTEADGMLKIEELKRRLNAGEWENYMKIVQLYKTDNPGVPVERYDYTLFKGEWLPFGNTIGTEYDERGLPVIIMDTVFDTYFYTAGFSDIIEAREIKRMEVTYNNDHMPATITEFNPEGPIADNDVWIPFRKREDVYNEDKKMIKNSYSFYEDGSWMYAYEYTYTYDDKGNLTSMLRIENGKITNDATYYENIYSPGNTSNEMITDLSKKIKTTFTNEQIHIRSEENIPFDVSVYSIQGVRVARQSGNHTVTISSNGMTRGIYIVHVMSGGNAYTQKLYIR